MFLVRIREDVQTIKVWLDPTAWTLAVEHISFV